MNYTTEIPKDGLWKFVKVDGEYRWIEMCLWGGGEHKDAVNEGETPESAGTIGVNETYWKMLDTYSMTLKIGTQINTVSEITRLLDKPNKTRY